MADLLRVAQRGSRPVNVEIVDYQRGLEPAATSIFPIGERAGFGK
ncbi:MAG: hypothetical protein ABI349_15690 [Casimicrobiaceae bacterium]